MTFICSLILVSRLVPAFCVGSRMSPTPSAFLLFAAALPLAASAANLPEPSVYDAVWDHAVLLRGAPSDLFQEVRITGREQFDWYCFGNGEDDRTGWGNRRSRLGLRTQFLRDWTFAFEADFNLGAPHPLFNKMSEGYLRWAPDTAAIWAVGRHAVRFTLDGATSSLVLPTIDRSAISGNIGLVEDSIPGVSFEGERGKWFYRTGVFSAGSADRYFGRFDAGVLGLVSTGWHFDEQWGLRQAFVRFDYLHLGADPRNGTGVPQPFTRDNQQAFSLNGEFSQGPWTLRTDVCASRGQGSQSDLRGLEFEPIYDLSPDWQLVFRYTYLQSKLNNGVFLPLYECWMTSGRGDLYQEYYLGLNRYFYGHKLKWMLAVEHARMHDRAADGGAYDGWGLTSGFRVSW
jgi:phosphate-selective porin OprO/OprP